MSHLLVGWIDKPGHRPTSKEEEQCASNGRWWAQTHHCCCVEPSQVIIIKRPYGAGFSSWTQMPSRRHTVHEKILTTTSAPTGERQARNACMTLLSHRLGHPARTSSFSRHAGGFCRLIRRVESAAKYNNIRAAGANKSQRCIIITLRVLESIQKRSSCAGARSVRKKCNGMVLSATPKDAVEAKHTPSISRGRQVDFMLTPCSVVFTDQNLRVPL